MTLDSKDILARAKEYMKTNQVHPFTEQAGFLEGVRFVLQLTRDLDYLVWTRFTTPPTPGEIIIYQCRQWNNVKQKVQRTVGLIEWESPETFQNIVVKSLPDAEWASIEHITKLKMASAGMPTLTQKPS